MDEFEIINSSILRNRSRFDQERMEEFDRILNFSKTHNCTFEQAVSGYRGGNYTDRGGNMVANIEPQADRFNPSRMDRYRQLEAYREKNPCSFEQAIINCPVGPSALEAAGHRERAELKRDLIVGANHEPIPEGTASEVLLVPWGGVESKRGRFFMDHSAAERTLAMFDQHGVDVPIDLEHNTVPEERTSPDGTAPAMGWVKSLKSVPPEMATRLGKKPGIYGGVKWTPRGEGFVRNREYRYLSPALYQAKNDGRILGLHSVGLTNKPAIVGMPAIVNLEPAGSREDVVRAFGPVMSSPRHAILI